MESSVNIVSTMMQFITPVIAGRIASALGISNTMVTTAIAAALPTILAALAGKASSPAGASALSNAVQSQDTNILGSFASMLGGPQQASLVNSGTSALSGLLGGSSTNALTGALAKFTGASTQQSGSLLGMLAPVVLSQLAQTQKSTGMDVSALLNSQKANIASAIPSGFSDLLGGTGLLDSVSNNLKAAAPAAPRIEIPRAPAAPAFNWMPWAIGALALLGIIYMMGNKPAVVAPQATVPAAPIAVPANVANATAAMDEARKIFGGLTSSLGNIKDTATAQAALPQLTASSAALDGLTKLAGSLAPDAKTQLRMLVAATMPQLSPLVETVLKIPGADALIKPVLDAIISKMTGLSKI